MSEISDAVTGTIGDLFGETEEAPAAEAEVAAQEAEVVVELPDWDAASRDLFTDDEDEEPDFSALDEDDEPVAAQPIEVSEYDDEETAKLKRQLLKVQKEAEHYQRQHLKSSRKSWEADVRGQEWGQFLPEDLSVIKASSHRDFIKQAKAVAKTNFTVLKPHLETLKAERERLKAQATSEAQQEVRDAWGKPTVGNVAVPSTAEQRVGDGLDQARKSRNLFRATKAMIDEGMI